MGEHKRKKARPFDPFSFYMDALQQIGNGYFFDIVESWVESGRDMRDLAVCVGCPGSSLLRDNNAADCWAVVPADRRRAPCFGIRIEPRNSPAIPESIWVVVYPANDGPPVVGQTSMLFDDGMPVGTFTTRELVQWGGYR